MRSVFFVVVVSIAIVSAISFEKHDAEADPRLNGVGQDQPFRSNRNLLNQGTQPRGAAGVNQRGPAPWSPWGTWTPWSPSSWSSWQSWGSWTPSWSSWQSWGSWTPSSWSSWQSWGSWSPSSWSSWGAWTPSSWSSWQSWGSWTPSWSSWQSWGSWSPSSWSSWQSWGSWSPSSWSSWQSWGSWSPSSWSSWQSWGSWSPSSWSSWGSWSPSSSWSSWSSYSVASFLRSKTGSYFIGSLVPSASRPDIWINFSSSVNVPLVTFMYSGSFGYCLSLQGTSNCSFVGSGWNDWPGRQPSRAPISAAYADASTGHLYFWSKGTMSYYSFNDQETTEIGFAPTQGQFGVPVIGGQSKTLAVFSAMPATSGATFYLTVYSLFTGRDIIRSTMKSSLSMNDFLGSILIDDKRPDFLPPTLFAVTAKPSGRYVVLDIVTLDTGSWVFRDRLDLGTNTSYYNIYSTSFNAERRLLFITYQNVLGYTLSAVNIDTYAQVAVWRNLNYAPLSIQAL